MKTRKINVLRYKQMYAAYIEKRTKWGKMDAYVQVADDFCCSDELVRKVVRRLDAAVDRCLDAPADS